VSYNPKLTGERMNKVNEASPANKVSDVERVVMRYPADNTKEPVYLIIQACTVDRCLSAMQKYLDEHGFGCGLGPVVSDLTLMAMGTLCAIESDA